MATVETASSDHPVWTALLTLALAALLGWQTLRPPAPVGIDAAEDSFSAGRAKERLRYLLGDEAPHPVGSPANRAVRDRLLTMLRELGLEVSVQRTADCATRGPVCANVENVLAQIPGHGGDAVALMAHYDSVPHAPGAGDDGAGVVTLLEAARALLAGAPYKNRVLLIFTDGEEVGLIGAEAFFAQHPWAEDVKAVINLEGAGTSGASLLLRTTGNGGRILETFREVSSFPTGMSVAQEVFARMPNDTDFSVAERAGVPGIDFAFGFEFNHYHTPLDTIDNLNKGSLQHHGENALPLARALARADLSETADNFVYLTPLKTFWLAWPTPWTTPLALLALGLLAVSTYLLRGEAGTRATAAGAGLAAAAMIAGAVLCFAALTLTEALVGTMVKFPGSFWPWRAIMVGAALLPACLLGYLARSRFGFWPLFLGSAWLLAALGLLLAVLGPRAANLLVVPTLVAALGATLLAAVGRPASLLQQHVLALLTILALGYAMLMMAYANEQTQGLTLAPAIFAPLALLSMVLTPLRPRLKVAGLAGTLLAAGIAAALIVPLYSEWRPQHVSIHYLLDLDEGKAIWAGVSPNPLRDGALDAFGPQRSEAPSVPWSSRPVTVAPAPLLRAQPPEVNVERKGNRVSIAIRSRRSGDFVGLALPRAAGIDKLEMAGHEHEPFRSGAYALAVFYAAGQAPVRISFEMASAEPVEAYVFDGANRLPFDAAVVEALRGDLAVPQHRGDQLIAYRRVRF